MTDPQQYVADQIGQQADVIRGDTASEQDIAGAALASAGIGVTSVDIKQLATEIAAMQARINDLEAEKASAAGHPLADTVTTINHFLGGHGDPRAIELGADLAAAVEKAQASGDASRVAQIAERLDRHLTRNSPYAGENYHYRNAVAFTGDLPDIIDGFRAAQVPAAPAKVVAGSVIG